MIDGPVSSLNLTNARIAFFTTSKAKTPMTEPQTDISPEELLYLRPTHYIDSDSREIHAFANVALAGMDPAASKTDIAIRLFKAVRDRLRYDPYTFALDAHPIVPA